MTWMEGDNVRGFTFTLGLIYIRPLLVGYSLLVFVHVQCRTSHMNMSSTYSIITMIICTSKRCMN